MDGIMRAWAKKKTQWKEDIFFTVKFAGQKLSKSYAEVTPTTAMLPMSADILNHFWMLQSFRRWDTGMDVNPEDETFYNIQYQGEFLKYVENEYCANHIRLPVSTPESVPSNTFFPSASHLGSSQASFDRYDVSSDDTAYWTQ